MSDEPTTSPGERTLRELRAKQAAESDTTFRPEVSLSLLRIELLLEQYNGKLEQHLIDDKEFQREIRGIVAENARRAEEKSDNVTSAVNKETLANRYTLTQMIAGWLTLCGSVGVLIYFIANYRGGPSP